jgi:hypothetical protein
MRFFVSNFEKEGQTILPDDNVFIVASKIGATGLYLYGKCALKTTAHTLFTKYRRPLTKREFAFELRNIGLPPQEMGRTEYTEADMEGFSSNTVFVPLGQTLPPGLAAQPRWKHSGSQKGILSMGTRLLDYANLLEVYAVEVPTVLRPFYSCVPIGISAPDDRNLLPALHFPPHPTLVLRAETCVRNDFTLEKMDDRKLVQIYRRVHASSAVPEVSLRGAPTRRHKSADVFDGMQCFEDGMVCRFKGGEMAAEFRPDGTLKIILSSEKGIPFHALDALVRNTVNPFVNLVNNTLRYDGPLEMDVAACEDSDTFSDSPFPLFRSFSDGGSTSIDVRIRFPGHLVFPMHVPPEWAAAFGPGPTYLRGRTPHPVSIEHCSEGSATLVTVRALCGPSYAPFAAHYVYGLLNTKSGKEELLQVPWPFDDAEPRPPTKLTLFQPLERLEKSGYSICNVTKTSATLRISDGVDCVVPLPSFASEANVRRPEPMLSAEETAALLEKVATILPVRPVGWVYNMKSAVVGVATEYGSSVPCKKTRTATSDWYSLYGFLVRAAVQGMKQEDLFPLHSCIESAESKTIVFVKGDMTFVPRRIAGRVTFPHDLSDVLRKRLVREVSVNVHKRCQLLNWTVQVGTIIMDKHPDELLDFS